MYEWLLSVEYAILDFIYNMHFPFLDSLMVVVTRLGDGGVLWILAGLLLLIKKESRRVGASLLLALLLNLVITNLTLKPLIQRMRPFEIRCAIELLITAPTDYSFPSGHTSASFAASTAVFIHRKKLGIVMYVIAFLIAFSRLYLYVHFPTDVLFAVIIGTVCGYVSAKIIGKLVSNYG